MRKSTALLAGLLLIGLFGAAAFAWPDRAEVLAHVLTAVVALVSAYIGLQVANNGVKGKCWNNDMYERENNEGKGKA